MVRIYGVPWSRASRCLWMLEEVGAEYECVSIVDSRDPDYLAINPNGRVPALVDGDVVIWESLAINLYLARRFPSNLSPRSISEEAHILKWSFWAESELECFFNRIASLEEVPAEWYEQTLRVLDTALSSAGYLVGGRFTVADVNAVNMFNGPVSASLDFSRHTHIQKWLSGCRARPAARRVLERIKTALHSSGGSS